MASLWTVSEPRRRNRQLLRAPCARAEPIAAGIAEAGSGFATTPDVYAAEIGPLHTGPAGTKIGIREVAKKPRGWPGPLPFPFGRLVRMWRARRVRILARLARTLGRFDRVSVVPLIGRELCGGLFLLIDHERDPSSPLPGNQPAGMRQG